jgi:imidazolonepropionase-like amidohydrolase
VVTDGRISAVGPAASVPIPAGATVVDARGKWVVPGLIDAHVHFFQSGNLYTRPDAADLRTAMPYAREVAAKPGVMAMEGSRRQPRATFNATGSRGR